MKRPSLCVAFLAGLFLALANSARAQPMPPALTSAHGVIDKVEKENLTIRPRSPDGKFEKSLVLKVTGTSKIASLTSRKQGGKTVIVQKDTEAKDLMPKQVIAAIYTMGADGPVLLTAVVLPPTEK